MRENRGHRCCGKLHGWADLTSQVIRDGEGGLLWQFSCPSCGKLLSSQPFAFPPDMPEPLSKDNSRGIQA